MGEILKQVIGNLRDNMLRTFLTMFGILWGIISVVILSATGEGFQPAISTCSTSSGATSPSCGAVSPRGRRAGSAPAAKCFSRWTMRGRLRASPAIIAVVSPELQARWRAREERVQRRLRRRSTAIEPQYQAFGRSTSSRGRGFRFADEERSLRVAVIGADLADEAVRRARRPRQANPTSTVCRTT